MPTAATETSPVTMPKMYGKLCPHTLLYGNLKSTVFRLYWSVTCASRPNRIGRSQTYNVMHCDYVALTHLISEHVNPYGRFDLDMNARLALL